MRACLRDRPLPDYERKYRYAEIVQRRQAAARGELFDGDTLAPVSRDPALWEIRWRFGGERDQFRQYHHEPPSAPGWLVALRFHRKTWVDGDPDETASMQNAEIDIATARLTAGRNTMWGISD